MQGNGIKQKIEDKAEIQAIRVDGSVTIAHVKAKIGGKTYNGYGWAKWSTKDMHDVTKLEKTIRMWNLLKQHVNVPYLKKRIDEQESYKNKIDWNENKGVMIAKSRAIHHIYEQINA